MDDALGQQQQISGGSQNSAQYPGGGRFNSSAQANGPQLGASASQDTKSKDKQVGDRGFAGSTAGNVNADNANAGNANSGSAKASDAKSRDRKFGELNLGGPSNNNNNNNNNNNGSDNTGIDKTRNRIDSTSGDKANSQIGKKIGEKAGEVGSDALGRGKIGNRTSGNLPSNITLGGKHGSEDANTAGGQNHNDVKSGDKPFGPKTGTPPNLNLQGKTDAVAKMPKYGDRKPNFDHKPTSPVRDLSGDQLAHENFQQRFHEGKLDRVVGGQVGTKLDLKEQYLLADKGDIARRFEASKRIRDFTETPAYKVSFEKHKDLFPQSKPYYFGHISNSYKDYCFKHDYCGPSWFAGVCWFPHWNPWVVWTWGYHCHPIYDPRPIWCRPIAYDPCPVWVYYEVPVFAPLPAVSCGTWVDVAKPVVREATDLQLLAVRFVDPGHPEENLGPRYRIWFRNNSDRPLETPFSVLLMASRDGRVTPGLPQAGVQVVSMAPGDTQSVDIRLPMSAMAMGRDGAGNVTPFGMLHVLVDANRALDDINRNNNGASVARGDVLAVDPAAFGVEPANPAPGAEVVLAGEGLGPVPGRVIVQLGGLEMDAEIVGWYDLGVRVALPNMPLAAPTEAELIVIRSDGAAANPVKVTMAPAAF